MLRSVNFQLQDLGMYSTRSSVTQLRPETVTQCVQEAEEEVFGKGEFNAFFPHDEPHVPKLGDILLCQSGAIKKIHNYFSQLESRKCCLHLACRRATVNSMRVVTNSNPHVDDGSGKKCHLTSEVQSLENEELRAFKHAYLCAVYPVLAAPNPPSPPSPALSDSTMNYGATVSTASHHAHAIYGSSHTCASGKSSSEGGRPTTPYSLHDSGVEESEETGLIPMESICEQLQRAFRLPRSVFRQYESMIIKTYAKKTSQKAHQYNMLLAEELCGQLVVLERGHHPFYNPEHFITQNGYDLWQKQERSHISSLLNKFWHTSLPYPADTQDLIGELYTTHDDYLILLKKLLSYESQFRQECLETNSTSFSFLSTASCRLLIEFGLRYGIGEIFQKIHYLECLSHEFNLSVGYLSFLHHLVHGIHQTLPKNKASVIMVREELTVLQASLRTLKGQTCKALGQMKSHFPNNKPVEGVELLLNLLRAVLSLTRYLAPSGAVVPNFESCLKTTIQSSFHPTYEKFKMVAKNDLEESRETRITPRLLNLLIQDIREDVSDYKSNFEGTFQKYFSITGLAAISYYEYLIADVRRLSQGEVQHKPDKEIDLRMLGFAFRLNQLESDWMPYIHELNLSWRGLFLPSVDQWTLAMKIHMQNLVLEAVSSDKYGSRNIELARSSLRAYQSSCNSSEQVSRSVSAMSFSPSVNSAFSSLINNPVAYQPDRKYSLDGSVRLTDDFVEDNAPEQKNRERDQSNVLPDFGYEPIKRQPSFLNETRSLNLTEQTSDFKTTDLPIGRRRSLPSKLNFLAKEAEEVFPFGDPELASLDKLSSNQNLEEESELRQMEAPDYVDSTDFPSPVNFSDSPLRDIPSDDSENEGEKRRHNASASSDEDESKFDYPPLTLESSTESMVNESDLTYYQSLSHSDSVEPPQTMPAFILNPTAPPSLSSKAPSIVDQPEESPMILENDLSDSMDSTISFPSPAISHAMLPVSGSFVDLLVMLQRICNFGHNIITIMLPDNCVEPLQGYFNSGQSRHSDYPSTSSDPPSGLESWAGSSPEIQNAMVGPASPNKEIVLSPDLQETSFSQEPPTVYKPNYVNSNQESMSQTPSTYENESSLLMMSNSFFALKVRLSLHLRLLKLTSNAVTIYTCNMLCMDLCGTPRNTARHMVGPKLLELAEKMQAEGLIWGCRHQKETDFNCLYYPNNRSRYLNGRYEAVTQNMCTRINNVFACLHVMDDFRDKLSKVLDADQVNEEDSFPPCEDGNWKEFDALWKDFTSSVSYEKEESSAERNQPPVSDKEKSSALLQQWTRLVEETVSSLRCHIMAVLTAMCRLLAHKLNLFVRDGLPLLLYLKKDNMAVPTLLERITSFLQKYFDSLSDWLYSESFRRTIDSLWVFMVQDFECEVEKLKSNGMTGSNYAHTWLLAIGHMIKFMNNNGKGIKKDLLLSQAANVIFRLQLHTLPTLHLIALFSNLKEYYFEGDHLTLEEIQIHRPPSILHRIHHDLQSIRKCFSGAELVHWLWKNQDNLPADLPVNFGSDSRQSAIILCQILLDQQFIVGIDFDSRAQSTSPMMVDSIDGISPYPQLSVHSHTFSSPMLDDDEADYELCSDGRVHRLYTPQSLSDDPGSTNTEEDTETEHKDNASVLSFREDTPVKEMTVQADVHSLRESDHNCSETPCIDVDNKKTFTNGQFVNPALSQSQLHPEVDAAAYKRTAFTTSYNSDAFASHSFSRAHQDSVTSEDSCFMHIKSNTPFGSLLTDTPLGGNQFQPTSRKFYFIHQNALHTGLTAQNLDSKSREEDSSLSDVSRALLRIRGSKESQSLVEQCIMHKVSSMSLLSIIASRKKADLMAKEFLNKLPSALRNKVYRQLKSPILNCRSS